MIKILVTALLTSSYILAEGPRVIEGDFAKGKELYAKCTSCHKKDGSGKASQQAPRLFPQYDWYVADQILKIKSKIRSGGYTAKMYPFVKNLSEQDINDLAVYISTMGKQ